MRTRIAQMIARVRQPGFFRDILSVAMGSAGSQAIVILSSPILLRVYEPTELGIQAVCVSLLFVSVVSSLRYNQAIPLPKDNDKARSIIDLTMVVVTLMAVLVGVVLWAFGDQIAGFTKTPTITEFLWLLPIIFLLGGTTEVFLNAALRMKRFKALGYAQVVQSGVQVIFQISVGLIDPSAKTLMLGLVAGSLAAILVYVVNLGLARPKLGKMRLFSRPSTLWKTAGEYRKFPLLAAPAALINAAAAQVMPILLAAFYSTNVVGWLVLAQRVVGLPITTIGYGVSQVFFQRAAEQQNQDQTQLLSLYRRAARTLFLIGLLPIGLLAVIAPYIVGLVFGQQWVHAGWYVTILAPMFLCQFAVSPLSQIVAVIGAQKIQLIWDITRFALVVGAIYLSAYAKLSADICVAIYGLVMSASYIYLYYLTIRAIKAQKAAEIAPAPQDKV